jgi:Tfp pilus assembly protein PilX
MIGRLLHEARGMALGLAIIVVVIVGVMGAGLLTLVATDLRAVMEVNRGEQAFELAEAGI